MPFSWFKKLLNKKEIVETEPKIDNTNSVAIQNLKHFIMSHEKTFSKLDGISNISDLIKVRKTTRTRAHCVIPSDVSQFLIDKAKENGITSYLRPNDLWDMLYIMKYLYNNNKNNMGWLAFDWNKPFKLYQTYNMYTKFRIK